MDLLLIGLISCVDDEVVELFYRQSYDLVNLLKRFKLFVERGDERCVFETDRNNRVVTLTIVSIQLKGPVNKLQSNQMKLHISNIKPLKHLLSAKQVRSLQDLPQDSIINVIVLRFDCYHKP